MPLKRAARSDAPLGLWGGSGVLCNHSCHVTTVQCHVITVQCHVITKCRNHCEVSCDYVLPSVGEGKCPLLQGSAVWACRMAKLYHWCSSASSHISRPHHHTSSNHYHAPWPHHAFRYRKPFCLKLHLISTHNCMSGHFRHQGLYAGIYGIVLIDYPHSRS